MFLAVLEPALYQVCLELTETRLPLPLESHNRLFFKLHLFVSVRVRVHSSTQVSCLYMEVDRQFV